MKKIDLEAHCYLNCLMDTLIKQTKYPYFNQETGYLHYNDSFFIPIKTPLWMDFNDTALSQRIQAMDDSGIDLQIISAAAGLEEFTQEVDTVTLAKDINDALYAATQKHPTRLKAYAALPILDTDAAVAELDRCVNELGFFGWNTFSNFGENGSLDDPRYFPILEKCAQLDVPIYLHPSAPRDSRFLGYGPYLNAVTGFTLDAVIALVRLMLSGTLDKLPNLKIIIGHLGECLPFFVERLDNIVTREKNLMVECAQSPGYYLRNNVVVTTSGQFSKSTYVCAEAILSNESILFGTDYPFEAHIQQSVDFVDSLSLSAQARENIYSGNAARLFNL